jgi:hypothetical protein
VGALRTIWRAGHGWVFLHKGMFPSAGAKNSENQREDHDIRHAIEKVKGRRVDTCKRTLWGCSTHDLEGRAWMGALAQGNVSLRQSKKLRKSKRRS